MDKPKRNKGKGTKKETKEKKGRSQKIVQSRRKLSSKEYETITTKIVDIIERYKNELQKLVSEKDTKQMVKTLLEMISGPNGKFMLNFICKLILHIQEGDIIVKENAKKTLEFLSQAVVKFLEENGIEMVGEIGKKASYREIENKTNDYKIKLLSGELKNKDQIVKIIIPGFKCNAQPLLPIIVEPQE
jgi:hypothetical protein